MNSQPEQLIVDIGGGSSCPFAKYKDPTLNSKIIAVDISQEELEKNIDADETRVANIMEALPFEDDSVDLVVSRSVLEHLNNLENFVLNTKRILRPGGYFIHLFPSKFAPFAVVNQLLPPVISKKILYFLHPESKGIGGFPAFYNKCYFSAITKLLNKYDFEILNIIRSYYQSRYTNFFVPLFLLTAVYEMLIEFIKVKNLCAFLLVLAQKQY